MSLGACPSASAGAACRSGAKAHDSAMVHVYSIGLHMFQSQERQQRVAHGTQSMSLTLGAAVTHGYVTCIKAAGEACTAACGRAGAWWLIS